ncbi:MAG: sigma-70 family RNA polymerase sigma factor [Candidatus Krumholzibacteria bacterium]|nr:sigma-70 family RNA polymerase sigma factor [Candidatus Krumholzibacteria bacterium]
MSRSSNPAEGSPGDADLVRVLRESSDPDRRRQAASELLMRYREAVYAWCYRYARSHDRALDLSQDVMVIAWRRMQHFEGRSKFSSWLFSVTRNRCIDASRRLDVMSEEPIVDDPPDPSPAPDEALAAEEREVILLDLIRSELDAVEQDAVYLRYFERMPVEDIGALLQIEGASGARAVLQRARRKLREAAHRRFKDGGELR